MTEKENSFERQFHTLRGYLITIKVSRAVKARRLGLAGEQDTRTVTVKLLECGAVISEEKGLHPENDDHTYTAVGSPFSGEPDPDIVWDLYRDSRADLWCGYYSSVFLKDPGLFESGLKIVFEVPEILAEKKPVLTLFCNNEKIHEEILDTPGVFERTADLRGVSKGMITYMKETRKAQAGLLDEMDRLSRKYGFHYYLICGGLIGAMRNGDLLPWDDDLDLAVTREDYKKLEQAASEEWKSGDSFQWVAPDSYGENVFLDYMTRIVDLKQTSRGDVFSRIPDKGPAGIHYRSAADIYIVDHASGSRLRHSMKSRWLQFIYVLALGHRGTFDPDAHQEYKGFSKILIKLLYGIGKKIPLSKLLADYRKHTERSEKIRSDYYYLSNGYYRSMPVRFPKEWFRPGRTACVNEREIPVPAEAEKWLRLMYGDYERYPCVWDRRPMHFKEEVKEDEQ